jgi:hypothetical protein
MKKNNNKYPSLFVPLFTATIIFMFLLDLFALAIVLKAVLIDRSTMIVFTLIWPSAIILVLASYVFHKINEEDGYDMGPLKKTIYKTLILITAVMVTAPMFLAR